jgi:hypothetical protein
MTMLQRYFSVRKPIQAWHLWGHMESNEYIGRSMCLWPVYQATTLDAGDEIHQLPGGIFGVRNDGEVLTCLKIVKPPKIKSVMLKSYGPPEVIDIARLAGDAVSEIQAPHKPGSYVKKYPPVIPLMEGFAKTTDIVREPGLVGRLLVSP